MKHERLRPKGTIISNYELGLTRDDLQMLFELREKLGKSKAEVLRFGLRRLYDIHIGLENLKSREVIYDGTKGTEKEAQETVVGQCAYPGDT